MRRMNLQRPHPHRREPLHVPAWILAEAWVHRTHRHQPVGVAPTVLGDIGVDRIGEPHQVGTDIVHQDRPLDPLTVEVFEESVHRSRKSQQALEVAVPILHGGQH